MTKYEIIDSHAHIGDCRISGHSSTVEEVIQAMDSNAVASSIALPFPGSPKNIENHTVIAEAAKDNPGRIYGVASLNPFMDDHLYEKEIRRCVEELGFVGIKLHPMYHACHISAPIADKVFRLAAEYDIPVLIHTGQGIPQALPGMAIGRAREYPQLRLIFCHAGGYILMPEAIMVADAFDNIYLETSWSSPHGMQEAIDKLGAHRVMFGADSNLAVADQIAKYHSLTLSDEDRQMCLSGTARAVFKLP